MPKTYGQYCGLAKALDHVGDRWSLLIVRELLVAPRRYSRLRRALPGIATNLLADRLEQMQSDGIVEQRAGAYELTAFGRELEDAVHALVRWGGRWMTSRSKTESFEPDWLVVALRAMLPKRRSHSVQLEVEGGSIRLTRTSIELGRIDLPDAVVEAPADQLLGVVAGHLPASRLIIRGNRRAAAAALTAAAGKQPPEAK